jgi:hypothetical protein
VLHYLETLAPSPLFDQLVAVAVSEAAALLGACQGAGLPAVARVVAQFRDAAGAALRRAGGGVGHARAGTDRAGLLAGDWGGAGAGEGFSDEGLELLLAEFEYLEQVVVTAESLCRRLPGQPELCGRIMATLLDGEPPPGGGGGGAPRRPRLGARRGGEGAALAGVAFMPVAVAGPGERGAIGGWLAQAAAGSARRRSLGGGGGGSFSSAGGGGSFSGDAGAAGGGPELGDPSHREWVLLCCPAPPPPGAAPPKRSASGASGARGGAAAAGGAPGPPAAPVPPPPPSRMYVQEAEGEMRLAFTLVSQQCL